MYAKENEINIRKTQTSCSEVVFSRSYILEDTSFIQDTLKVTSMHTLREKAEEEEETTRP